MPSKMKRPWTMADVERLRALAEKGKTIIEIADAMGRSWESTRGVLLRHGITVRERPVHA
jgi:hypothetical protein